MAKIGLVTVLYGSDEVLEGFFKSLASQTYIEYHLYLVDNKPSANTDNLINSLLIKYPIGGEYTHIKNTDNVGVAAGNNQGISLALQANVDHVILLNNDIEFYQPSLIDEMIADADKGEELIIPKILYYNSRTIWMAGGHLLKKRGYTIHVGENDEDNIKYNKNGYFDYAPTCFMLINKNVFERIGLMDEKYFVYFDDTDFVYRAVEAGYKIYLMSNLEVFHKVSSSTGGHLTLFSIYYANRNRIYFIKKNLNGFNKMAALTYTFLSCIYKLMTYNKPERDKLLSSMKDALKM
jgi:GT2 family glycosyltransferase